MARRWISLSRSDSASFSATTSLPRSQPDEISDLAGGPVSVAHGMREASQRLGLTVSVYFVGNLT